ncbi:MAG: ABC transporter substrate-binding protein, partial [Candidatus Heimdallarchaeaceae archaeon]
DWTGLTSFPAERKQMQADPRYDVQTAINPSYTFMIYNMRRPFIGGASNHEFLDAPGKEEYTKGVAVRKAIAYAIDREEINQVIHDGEYLLAHCPLYPYTAFYYYNDIIKYDRNLEAALEWLNAAGYDPGIEVTPLPIFGVIAAIGAAALVAVIYKRRK